MFKKHNKNKKIISAMIVILAIIFSIFHTFNNKTQEKNIYQKESNYPEIITLMNEGKYEQAIAKLETFDKSSNQEVLDLLAHSWLALATIKYQEKEYGKIARKYIEQSISQFGENSENLRLLAYSYEIIKDYDNAIKNYNKSYELSKNDPLILTSRGHAYDLKGDFENAIKDYKLAFELDSKNPYIILNIVRYYMREGKFVEAELSLKNIFENSKATKRDLAEAYYIQSSIELFLKDDFSKSFENAQKSVLADSEYVLGYVGMSRAEIYQNNFDNAEQNLKQALKIYPDLAAAYEWYGLLEEKRGNLDLASQYFEKSILASQKDIQLMNNERELIVSRNNFYQSTILARQGKVEQSFALIEDTLEKTDVLTFAMFEKTFDDGHRGFYANLLNDSRFIAMVNSESNIKKFSLINVAHAQQSGNIEYFWPHGEGNSLDSTLHSALRRYVNGEISRDEAFNICQQKVRSVNSRQNCELNGSLPGSVTIGCNNTISARYTPPTAPPPAPVNGQCGSANSQNPVTFEPNFNLCQSGSASVVSYVNGVYQWTCNGSNGGSSVSCSVPRYINNNTNDNLDIQCEISDTSVEDGDDITVSVDIDGGRSPYDIEWDGDTDEFEDFDDNDDSQRVTVDTNEDRIRLEVTVRDRDGNRRTDTCSTIRVDEDEDDEDRDVRVITNNTTDGELAGLSSVFLSQVPYTGPAEDMVKIISFISILLVWSAIIAFIFIKHRKKKLISQRIASFKENNRLGKIYN